MKVINNIDVEILIVCPLKIIILIVSNDNLDNVPVENKNLDI